MTVVNAGFFVRRFAAAVALGALLAVILPVATTQAATTYSISGTVSLPSGAPSAWLQGVYVSASGNSGYGWNMVNPTTGAYTITSLGAGDYVVYITAGSYDDAVTHKTVYPNLVSEFYSNSATRASATTVKVASANVSSVNATLDLGRTISGKVTLPASVPVAALGRVNVVASDGVGDAVRNTMADATTGEYTLVGLRPGSYRVSFNPNQYYDAGTLAWVTPNLAAEMYNNTHTVANATLVNVTSSDATAINATLEEGLTISGKVTLPAGSPKEWYDAIGVSATVPDGVGQHGFAVVDPETGNYSISGLGAGQYTVAFNVSDYRDDVLNAWLSPNLMDEYYPNSRSSAGATKVNLGTGGASGINVTLDRGAMLSGTVSGMDPAVDYGDRMWSVTTASGEPVLTSTFETWVNGAATSTPTVNAFALGGLEPGSYRIMLTRWDALGTASQQYLTTAAGVSLFTVTQGQTLSGLSFTLRPATATVAGTLTTSGFSGYSTGSGEPDYLADVVLYEKLGTSWVRYPSPANGATANGATAYTIPGLGAGTYTVGFEKSQTPYTKNGALAEQWFNGKSSLTTANAFALTAGQAKTGVNGAVAPLPQISFTTVPTPTVTGTANVGNNLIANVGTWSPKPDSYAYQWYRDGVAITGATYSQRLLTASDAGHKVSVAVTGKKTGYTTASKSSALVSVPLLTYTTVPTPAVSGTAAVDSKVTAYVGTWAPKPDSYAYQWYRDGVAIPGATFSQYRITVADAGHQVSVVVTAIKVGYTKTGKGSARVSVPLLTYTTVPTPTISGTAVVGNKLTANVGTWAPKPDSYGYQWYRDGVAITGATYSQYRLTTSDAGHQVSVVVTGKKVGYTKAAKGSARTTIT